jgi:hypothetical protein
MESLAFLVSIVVLVLIGLPLSTLALAWFNWPVLTLLFAMWTVVTDLMFLASLKHTKSAIKILGWFGLLCVAVSLALLVSRMLW